MAIEINNEYPEFSVAHTLHQLVDKLNDHSDVVDANIRLLDSAVNNSTRVYNSNGTVTADSDLTITADNLSLTVDSDASFTSYDFTQTVENDYTLSAGNIIRLSSNNNLANVLLRADSATYGGFRNNNGQLEILSGVLVAQTCTSTGTTFSGEIVMPSTGDGSPETDNKTVHGAINELHDEINDIVDTEVPRITSLETSVSTLNSNLTSLQNSLNSVSDRVTTLEALNISTRLTKIESQIVQINDRLNILNL